MSAPATGGASLGPYVSVALTQGEWLVFLLIALDKDKAYLAQ